MIRIFKKHNTATDDTPDRRRVLLTYDNQQLDKRWGVLSFLSNLAERSSPARVRLRRAKPARPCLLRAVPRTLPNMKERGITETISGTGRRSLGWGIFQPAKWGIFRLFRHFGAAHGARESGVAEINGSTRALNRVKPARPYIWRLRVLSRLT
jgi:hypothetical protein